MTNHKIKAEGGKILAFPNGGEVKGTVTEAIVEDATLVEGDDGLDAAVKEGKPMRAWAAEFVAVMTLPIKNQGNFFAEADLDKTAALSKFEDFLKEEQGLTEYEILSFEPVMLQ